MRAKTLVTKRRFYSGSNECYGRHKVEAATLDRRLEISSPDLQEHSVDLEDGAGPFRQLLERAIASLCQPLPPAGGLEDGRLLVQLEGSVGVLLPPFNLIPFYLTKIRQEQAEIVLVAPYWPSQFWFPSLMELATDIPVLLFPSKSLLTSPLGECHPLTVSEVIRLILESLRP